MESCYGLKAYVVDRLSVSSQRAVCCCQLRQRERLSRLSVLVSLSRFQRQRERRRRNNEASNVEPDEEEEKKDEEESLSRGIHTKREREEGEGLDRRR